jgi:hypothetical protein
MAFLWLRSDKKVEDGWWMKVYGVGYRKNEFEIAWQSCRILQSMRTSIGQFSARGGIHRSTLTNVMLSGFQVSTVASLPPRDDTV